MAISEGDRALRLGNVFLWIPSFALLLAYGISARQVSDIVAHVYSSMKRIVDNHPTACSPTRKHPAVPLRDQHCSSPRARLKEQFAWECKIQGFL